MGIPGLWGSMSCMFQRFLCSIRADLNQCVITWLLLNLRIQTLNQVYWSREASKTCRTADLEDKDWPPLIHILIVCTLKNKTMCHLKMIFLLKHPRILLCSKFTMSATHCSQCERFQINLNVIYFSIFHQRRWLYLRCTCQLVSTARWLMQHVQHHRKSTCHKRPNQKLWLLLLIFPLIVLFSIFTPLCQLWSNLWRNWRQVSLPSLSSCFHFKSAWKTASFPSPFEISLHGWPDAHLGK